MNDTTDMREEVHAGSRAADRAQALLELGRYGQAIPLLARAIAQSPEDAWLRCRLADAYYGLGDYARALEHAGTALGLDPGSDYPHFRMAACLLRLHRPDPALEHARAAVRIDSDDGANLAVLAWAEYRSGHHRAALKAAERAVELDPEDGSLHALLGDLKGDIRRKPAEAEPHYREALRHDPEDADLHASLGASLAAQNKTQEAAQAYLRAVKLNPADPELRDLLFELIHDRLAAPSKLAALDPAVRAFYEDALGRRSWFNRLRMATVIGMWIGALAVLSWLMSWLAG